MDGEQQRQRFADLSQGVEQAGQHLRPIHIGWPMQGNHPVAALQIDSCPPLPQPGKGLARWDRPRKVGVQGVDHHIAGEVDPGGIDALARQVFQRTPLGGEQQVGELIGQYPVDLLRHVPVEAAQPRLHVDHRHPLFRRHQSTGDGGVDVSHHQHGMGPATLQLRLEALHDLCRLHRMAGGTHLQVHIRLRYPGC